MLHHSREASSTAADESSAVDRVYVDDRELARRTPLARATWQKMRAEGKGPSVRKIGRRCLYLWSEVVGWLESHREGTAA
jgi:predicted DNA-binding transcriptional regulator AlpA